nr:hypothetical protein GCM10020093_030320 [Planobispora longispora]
MTETTALAINNAGADYAAKPDSIGLPVAVVDVKIADPLGEELPVGEVGELCMRGPNVIMGYWNRPEATAETFVGGWLHTGDLARIDEDGFVYIVDRAKDMVIRGGENVYCAEVEAALFEHPAIDDAAVIGIPHDELGEEVGAVVRLKAPATPRSSRSSCAGGSRRSRSRSRSGSARPSCPATPAARSSRPTSARRSSAREVPGPPDNRLPSGGPGPETSCSCPKILITRSEVCSAACGWT